jgi:cytochrome c oxidase subunit 2
MCVLAMCWFKTVIDSGDIQTMISRHIAKSWIFVAAAICAVIAGSAGAAEPQAWQIGLQDPAGSIAEKANSLHNLLLVIITAISVFVLALLVYTCVRYREKANPKPSRTTHNTVIEILWTVVPVLILVVIAVPSFRLLYYLDDSKQTEMVVKITGNQWYWNYEYPEEGFAFDSYIVDESELEEGQPRLLTVDYPMVVPEGTKIKLLITGNDVMHSFFVPSLAVQTYSIIGQINEAWIDVPMGEKTYYGQCNQICGVNHAYMPIVIEAVSATDYADWLATAKQEFALNNMPVSTMLASAQ